MSSNKELNGYKPHATSIATTGSDTITPVHQTHKQSKHKEELETMHGDNSRYLSCLLEVDLK